MDRKKLAAAVGGVMEYLKEREPACAPAVPAPAATAVNLWGLSGRQQIMMMGNLLQMRLGTGR